MTEQPPVSYASAPPMAPPMSPPMVACPALAPLLQHGPFQAGFYAAMGVFAAAFVASVVGALAVGLTLFAIHGSSTSYAQYTIRVAQKSGAPVEQKTAAMSLDDAEATARTSLALSPTAVEVDVIDPTGKVVDREAKR